MNFSECVDSNTNTQQKLEGGGNIFFKGVQCHESYVTSHMSPDHHSMQLEPTEKAHSINQNILRGGGGAPILL